MRCRICDNVEAEVLDPITRERLCGACAESIQEVIGTNWAVDEAAKGAPSPYDFDYRDDDWSEDE
ncbi:MAG: hypothetical protein JKY50_00245 [Oleispira sp.]|nr:hypothetical protein [Oleispira sp.]